MLDLIVISDNEYGIHIIFTTIYRSYEYFTGEDLEIEIPKLIKNYKESNNKEEFLKEFKIEKIERKEKRC